jgi:hypothetical protein
MALRSAAAGIEAEARGVPYLFKLRLTTNVKRTIERLSRQHTWAIVGQGFEAKESMVRLVGWSRQRRAIVLRRRVKRALAGGKKDGEPMMLTFVEISDDTEVYEYCVLATSMDEELSAFGFTTHDMARCAARLVALFYNWWNIFVRLAEPDRHMEAITSRPLLLHAIATRIRHARQTALKIASSHAKAFPAAKALRSVIEFLRGLTKNAEQLSLLQIWQAILARAFQAFLRVRPLRPFPRLNTS